MNKCYPLVLIKLHSFYPKLIQSIPIENCSVNGLCGVGRMSRWVDQMVWEKNFHNPINGNSIEKRLTRGYCHVEMFTVPKNWMRYAKWEWKTKMRLMYEKTERKRVEKNRIICIVCKYWPKWAFKLFTMRSISVSQTDGMVYDMSFKVLCCCFSWFFCSFSFHFFRSLQILTCAPCMLWI